MRLVGGSRPPNNTEGLELTAVLCQPIRCGWASKCISSSHSEQAVYTVQHSESWPVLISTAKTTTLTAMEPEAQQKKIQQLKRGKVVANSIACATNLSEFVSFFPPYFEN